MNIPTRRRVGDVFCTASRRTTTTSPKPLTDKLDHQQTSHKNNRQAGSIFPTFMIGLMWVGIYSRDPELGSMSHYITPPSPDMPFISHFKDDRNTSRATDRSLRGLFVFYWVEFIFICCDFKTQKTAEPSTCPASITINSTTQKEKEAT